MSEIILESLHPELQTIVKSKTSNTSKQTQLAKKIKDLVSRGENTGLEGNMPKGSSRAFLRHADPHHITLDGKETAIKTGTKVAIKASLDKYHNAGDHDDLKLGAMQNRDENGDHWTNNHYRILTKKDDNHYETNKEDGIFPPLIDHDHDHHEWSHVGAARDIRAGEFHTLTKTKEFPKGISHKEFTTALERNHERNNGRYWERGEAEEAHLDHVESHPLVQRFTNYHDNTGHPPYDYRQIKNLGVFEHPDGTKHIVARDHGFSTEVAHAYTNARKNMVKSKFGNY